MSCNKCSGVLRLCLCFQSSSVSEFCSEQPEGAERRSVNLIIRVESQIGGISRQELSVKAADLKMFVNLTRLVALYFIISLHFTSSQQN